MPPGRIIRDKMVMILFLSPSISREDCCLFCTVDLNIKKGHSAPDITKHDPVYSIRDISSQETKALELHLGENRCYRYT